MNWLYLFICLFNHDDDDGGGGGGGGGDGGGGDAEYSQFGRKRNHAFDVGWKCSDTE